ncbi:MAG: RnfABCDGE type electron transport complex subunit D [Candidatus Riflebacteria bacterium]|nr:RnfABCDGE type electron transport complex subunit D [Candidatus Riflebacteria bacterium]
MPKSVEPRRRLALYPWVVLLAVLPVYVGAVGRYGLRVLAILGLSVLTGVLVDALAFRLRRDPAPRWSWTAWLVLPLALPAGLPLWMPPVGLAFALVFAMHFLGGCGRTLFPVAATAVVFLTLSYPGPSSQFCRPFDGPTMGFSRYEPPEPASKSPLSEPERAENPADPALPGPRPANGLSHSALPDSRQANDSSSTIHPDQRRSDAPSSSTFPDPRPADDLFRGALPDTRQAGDFSCRALLTGEMPGPLGASYAGYLALLATAMLLTGFLDPRFGLPALLAAVLAAALGHHLFPARVLPPLVQVLAGGFLLCLAVFVPSEPAALPRTPEGRWLGGALFGLLTVLIRGFSDHGEGVWFALLLTAGCSPLIDQVVGERLYGRREPAR